MHAAFLDRTLTQPVIELLYLLTRFRCPMLLVAFSKFFVPFIYDVCEEHNFRFEILFLDWTFGCA